MRHIERTRLLLHLIDFSDVKTENILDQYHKLQKELKAFSKDLFQKPQILVATKMDTPQSVTNFKNMERLIHELNPSLFAISSVTGEGIDKLLWQVKEILAAEKLKEEEKEL